MIYIAKSLYNNQLLIKNILYYLNNFSQLSLDLYKIHKIRNVSPHFFLFLLAESLNIVRTILKNSAS